ncbi:cytochrome c, class I [Psychromonas ingrahamii 37]|uniref:Cytochrome c, class I n=1 Tax=Psychromonas ingrahamii (strain DSM 17664 / CCUG 51855 / 37) TaxID=357804 RepID=A1SRG2_PSYIN|nr:c-type cytochrome [Psychromonas ingrahamii]ABM02077.1 cytochrome c, class I [Psychromonas ingrahamii 37]
MNKLLIAFVAVLSFSSFVQAQGNIEAGKAKSATCAACHGADGNSASNLYPKLAGQHAPYLEKQLQQFKNGERANAIMMGMASVLSTQDMQDLAAYYASNTMTPEMVSPEIVTAGEKLYMAGKADRKMAACTACHGPRGNGLELANFPKISSQHPAYIKAQLEKFRSKERMNSPNGMMNDVAAKLSDADIELLSKYISALH